MAITETRVLTAKQVREDLGVSRATVDRLLASASGIAEALQKRTGVSIEDWKTAGQEMLEAV
ncbi:MAG: hypothetical protein M3475_05575, partial [Actinomycetota bacterium]|nr:hypothetical protein [Actinomycetota bacterium]